MSLWSKSGDKPKNLNSVEKRNVIATGNGWVNRKVYTDNNGAVRTKDEVLVNISGLAAESTMGNPFVTAIYAANTAGGSTIKTNSATTIKVVFSEPVSVKAAAAALVFNLRNLTANSNIVATASTNKATISNANNTVTFTLPGNLTAGNYKVQAQTMTGGGTSDYYSLVGGGSEGVNKVIGATASNTSSFTAA